MRLSGYWPGGRRDAPGTRLGDWPIGSGVKLTDDPGDGGGAGCPGGRLDLETTPVISLGSGVKLTDEPGDGGDAGCPGGKLDLETTPVMSGERPTGSGVKLTDEPGDGGGAGCPGGKLDLETTPVMSGVPEFVPGNGSSFRAQ